MTKVILLMMVSADGYVEGKKHTYHWHNWDEEMANTNQSFN